MKGKHLVIGLVLFIIIVVAAIYFTMMSTFNKDENGLASANLVYELSIENKMSS